MFSRTSEYALRSMTCLALHPGQVVPTPVLAREARVPENYLAKVLQQLAASELIVGRRGVGGGYRLLRPAADVRLIEVLRAVSELDRITSCPHGRPGARLCALHRVVDEVHRAVIVILDGSTLQDIIDSDDPPLCACAAAGLEDDAPPTIAVNGHPAQQRASNAERATQA